MSIRSDLEATLARNDEIAETRALANAAARAVCGWLTTDLKPDLRDELVAGALADYQRHSDHLTRLLDWSR